ncbi:MAG: hypothetical protein HQM10_14875 [Candidatus Riflebacteria bacterium]|nr:hypothetical protein [Candidatus Riflebacteria bacterium]
MQQTIKRRKICLLKTLAFVFLSLVACNLYAGSSYPVPHSPKPVGDYVQCEPPDSYPFSPEYNIDIKYETTFSPAGLLDTPQRIASNTPFLPGMYKNMPVMYFGPDNLGSYKILGGKMGLTPDKEAKTSWDFKKTIHAWRYADHYDWTLVNYWYSVPISWATYCWSGGCVSGKGWSYCWSGGCTTYATDYNYYEVYYWTRGPFKFREKVWPINKLYPTTVKTEERGTWDKKYYKRTWVTNSSENQPWNTSDKGIFAKVHPLGLADFYMKYDIPYDKPTFNWYGYSYTFPGPYYVFNETFEVHPLPAHDPRWRSSYNNVWYPNISDTKVCLQFWWVPDYYNKKEENYYIEYNKIFDGKIKMRDIVKLLSNLGYGQVDIPIYMALESDKPKLYLVTTPTLVKGVRKAPAPYTPVVNADGSLKGVSITPGYTLHPSAESYARGYIRECKEPLTFGKGGKPVAGPIKYVFTKMFDYNNDDKIDNTDKVKFERGLKIADFDENNKINSEDCNYIWCHSFQAFPKAFELLASHIREEFRKNPKLIGVASTTTKIIKTATGTYSVTTKFTIIETKPAVAKSVNIIEDMRGGNACYATIGWEGTAWNGKFTITPWSKSKKFPFSAKCYSYASATDRGITGKNFLPNLGPASSPKSIQELSLFPHLYGHGTHEFPDGTLLGKFKRFVIQTYPKCDFTDTQTYPVGDPWRNGLLESYESGNMGGLFIFGDVNGDGSFDAADLAKWEEVRSMNGFLLNSVWQHDAGVAMGKAVLTDYNKEFRVIAAGKFSLYPPKGSTYFEVKDSYNYRFTDPVIWAYDPNGNQFSEARRFAYDPGWTPPVTPPVPPYPPVETRQLPTAINGPNEVPEDIPQTWTAPGVEDVVIVPGAWTQTWKIPGLEGKGGTGSGVSFSYEFLESGRYTVYHTVTYTQRIVTPVTDGLGIIVYYAVTDIPQTRTLTKDVIVKDHSVADFEDPKLTITGFGNVANYAHQWGADMAPLRKRDFPTAFRAYNETRATDLTVRAVPFLSDNDWYAYSSGGDTKEYHDHHFDVVDADITNKYNFPVNLEVKFARNVKETSDLNAVNALGNDDLEAYSGVVLESPFKLNVEVKQKSPSGGESLWKTFEYTPNVSPQGATLIDKTQMSSYLIKSGARYLTVDVSKFATNFAWEMPTPTFPNEGYEIILTLTYTQRDFYVDHSSEYSNLSAKFGSDYSKLTLTGSGILRYIDRARKIVWKRKAFTVDVTPPTITEFNQSDCSGNMVSVGGDGVIRGTTGDQIKYGFTFSDNHPGHGPNDGLKNGGTRRAWYPRFWIQSIDGSSNRLSLLAKSGYELPLILPGVHARLLTSNDGDLAADVDSMTKVRVDNHFMAVTEPSNVQDVGTIGNKSMKITHQLSNYIAGKIAYVLEIEDSSRNYLRQDGFIKIIDNKRPNIDLRLVTPKYKPLPDDGTLTSISNIITQVPLGPSISPFGTLTWAPSSTYLPVLNERTAVSKPGLLKNWVHSYNLPDMKFNGGTFTNNFKATGYAYKRDSSLDEASNNRPICLDTSLKSDDPVIKLTDANVKAAFDLANPGGIPGFAEDEVITFDLSIRDNILFLQDDSVAVNGCPVPQYNFKEISYKFTEDVIDEKKNKYHSELASSPVSSSANLAPMRLLNPDGTTLSYVFRVGNADSATGLKNSGTGPNVGSNTFQLKVVDLSDNSRELFIDFPIIPSKFNIRVLESQTTGERR